MTAKYLIAAADSLAVTFASHAQQAYVKTSDIDTTGNASIWTYVYFSFDTSNQLNSRAYSFVGQNNHVTFDHWDSLGDGPWILINHWMDSDSALLVAQRGGGSDIRRRFPMCTISALLMQMPAPPFYTEWQISYRCSDSTRRVDINATTGDVVEWVGVVTAVKEAKNQGLPILFELHQNYPNPFNPSTTITYDLPKSSVVRLTVYDMLGREVSVLVNDRKDAGYHEVRFDGKNLSNGVYFYRLEAGSFVQTRKLLLIR